MSTDKPSNGNLSRLSQVLTKITTVSPLPLVAYMKNLIIRITNIVSRGGELLGTVASCTLMFAISADVVLRYFFNSPIRGIPEISQMLLLPAIVFLPLASSVLSGSHVKITILYDKFPDIVRGIIDRIASLLAFSLWTGVAWVMVGRGMAAYVNDHVPVSGFSLPYYYSYSLVALGAAAVSFATLAVFLLPKLFKDRQIESKSDA